MDSAQSGMNQIMAAVALLQSGDRAAARQQLIKLWGELGECGTPLQRCTVAHFLADTEEETSRELSWDIAALEAATGASSEEDRDALSANLASFLPSLHLNAGDAYRRLAQYERARHHAVAGLKRAAALPENGYGTMIREGLLRLQERLSARC